MFNLVKMLSSTVRRLAERHARLQGTVLRLQALTIETAAKLSAAQAQLDAVALVLPTFDGRVRPALIESINGWDRLCGKRGGLKRQVLEVLAVDRSRWKPSGEIADAVTEHFQLTFGDAAHRKYWTTSILCNTLWRLSRLGVLERQAPAATYRAQTHWRLAQPHAAWSLDSLREAAAIADLETT